MSQFAAIVPQVNALKARRHLWPRIARELVCIALPQVSARTAMSHQDVASTYNLTLRELYVLSELDEFAAIVKKEAARARQMGHNAGFLFRAETVAVEALETMHDRLNGEAELRDIIKGVELLVKVAGLGVEKEQTAAVNTTVAVQFNLPALDNPKLKHLVN